MKVLIMPDQRELQVALQYTFADPELLQIALTHPSYAAEHKDVEQNNQRLEFLGDAVLQLVITDMLYRSFPELHEGALTKVRALMTCKNTLAEFARTIRLGSFLAMGCGEQNSGGADRTSNLCDAFESVLGAIYIDSGGNHHAISPLINTLVSDRFPDPLALLAEDNPKGLLQEWSQRHFHAKPLYCVESESGPEHEKSFSVTVSVGEKQLGRGVGRKRQVAEQDAARNALRTLRATETTAATDTPTKTD